MEYKVKEDLQLLIFDGDYPIEEIAKEIGVSKATLFNALKDDSGLDKEVIEKIYSYMYKSNLRLNNAKEELYKELNDDTILFHGSKIGLDNISPDGSRKTCDFGPGFYLGESYKQAISFVSEYDESSVYVFKAHLDGLKVKTLDCDLDWMLLVCYYRGTIKPYENHPLIKKILKSIEDVDVLIAPIADNRMYYIMQQFADGEITTSQAIYSLSTSSLGKQYIFKTQKGIDSLLMLERLYVSKLEKEYFNKLSDGRGAEIDTKLKLAKRQFKGEGRYIDEIFI